MPLERLPSRVPEQDPRERALARTLGQSELLARVLLARGCDDPARARVLLRPDLSSLADPFSFVQMERAVDRIRAAIRGRQRILIHGDYDVDGISGAVLLRQFLSLLEVDATAFVPDRRDGYSFSAASFAAVESGGYALCISVDNGTNATTWIERIQQAGCDVIVTDHHGTSDNVAPAYAVLNPRLPDAGYPDRDLAGCGVAFRLAAAVAQSFTRGRREGDEFAGFLLDAMAYVALGTIADVAPLRGENRAMVYHGLRALAVSKNPGIRALLDCAGLANRTAEAEDIAFRIAPLINAAGRMGHANDAVRLLTARGYQEAQEAAKVLERHNEQRRRIERELVERVRIAAERCDDAVLVLAGDDWHAGVLGIVAARLAETTGRPAILVTFQGEVGRGSGRSSGGLDLREALHACAPLLVSHGGHAAAAGLEIRREQFDAFRAAINAHAAHAVRTPNDLTLDGTVTLAELDPREVRGLDQLGPFGAGNPRPAFVTRGVRMAGVPAIDARSGDLRFRVTQDGTLRPARMRSGTRWFERVRALDGPFDVVHAPRTPLRAEDGPVELVVARILRPDGPSLAAPLEAD
ncbi:MAG: single-stranded-DNA-specific exonuclease RecJ [Planctomycetes bacterium]|nr:single-stranded-DNA-specific exonuclease RecJ [Planctomycetota bacterium]